LDINVREYRRGKQKWTIERNWQHRVQEDEEKHKKHNTIYVGISAISWRSVLLVEESGVAGENHHRYLSIELGRNYYFWHSYRPISIGDYKLHQLPPIKLTATI
jgi:hypothetical protein